MFIAYVRTFVSRELLFLIEWLFMHVTSTCVQVVPTKCSSRLAIIRSKLCFPNFSGLTHIS